MKPVLQKFADVKILFFDLDGVLNTISESNDDKLFCNEFPGFCSRCESFGLKVYVITGREEDEIVQGLKEIRNCYVRSASVNKVQAAGEVLLENFLNFDQAFFIGDNILDIPLIQRVGLTSCPSNARREVKRIVDFICEGNNCKDILTEISGYIENTREV